MNKLLQRILTALSIAVAAAFLLSPAVALAQNQKDICEGVNFTGGNSNCDDAAAANKDASDKVSAIIKTVIQILSLVVGLVSVVMIIIGGFKYVTSMGDSNNVNSAKNTILYAIIGLVVVAMAQIIVAFVLSKTSTAGGGPSSSNLPGGSPSSRIINNTNGALNGEVKKAP